METDTTSGAEREADDEVHRTNGADAAKAAAQLSGKAEDLRHKAQKLCADAASVARESIAANPVATLALTAAVGFFLGAIWSPNSAHSDDDANEQRDWH
jgi:ElaB/YqjD/DUF883 family membrane-anchored ribosome-binding protein